jgi:mitogen-activated protein kinase organizer 1
MLLSCLDDSVRLLERSDGSLLNEYKGHKNNNYKTDSLFSSDDALVVSASEDGLVYVWDLVDGKIKQKLKGHEKGVTSLALHTDDEYLLSGSLDKTIRVWK